MSDSTIRFYFHAPMQTVDTGTAQLPYRCFGSGSLRSGMGFGGCFTDLSLLEGEFHEHVVAPLLRSPQRMDGMRRYLLGATWAPVDALEQLHARITMPVLLVWGADDSTFPLEYARTMVRQLPDARLVEIPGARLLVHEEKPAEVARAVLDFLG